MKTILKGIIQYLHPSGKYGFIKSESGEKLIFSTNNVVNNTTAVGEYVTFLRVPSKKEEGEFEAVNITTAYLSADNYYVVDRPFSHLHQQIEDRLSGIVESISCNDRSFITQQIDHDHPVGSKTCVKVNNEDKIIYAIRKGRKGYTKFVKDRSPEPTNCITIVLKKTIDFYTIITAFFGEIAEVEPWDERATEQSYKFWNEHALIYGTEIIDLESVRINNPWNTLEKPHGLAKSLNNTDHLVSCPLY